MEKIFYTNILSVSSTELIELNDRISSFRKLSTHIICILFTSLFSNLEYLLLPRSEKRLNKLIYGLISYLNHSISRKNKLLIRQGFAFLRLFIIDKEGIIQYYNNNNLLCGRNIN